MNWEAIGAFGEVIGALAVLISLFYLASQIKRQNFESRRASNEAGIRHFTSIFGVVAEDPNLADIVLRGSSGELSDPEEVFRYYSHVGRMLRGVENIYLAYIDGVFDERIWEGTLNFTKDFLNLPGNQSYWETRCHYYSKEFREFVDGLAASVDDRSMLADYDTFSGQ